jgi:hypothetical protein
MQIGSLVRVLNPWANDRVTESYTAVTISSAMSTENFLDPNVLAKTHKLTATKGFNDLANWNRILLPFFHASGFPFRSNPKNRSRLANDGQYKR